MADIELHRAHNLGLRAARIAADKMAERLGRKFGLKGDWEGNVYAFARPGVTGSLVISDKDLRLSVALGFLLKAMKGSIERAVVQELDSLFAKGEAGPLPGSPPRGREKSPPKARTAKVSPKKGR